MRGRMESKVLSDIEYGRVVRLDDIMHNHPMSNANHDGQNMRPFSWGQTHTHVFSRLSAAAILLLPILLNVATTSHYSYCRHQIPQHLCAFRSLNRTRRLVRRVLHL